MSTVHADIDRQAVAFGLASLFTAYPGVDFPARLAGLLRLAQETGLFASDPPAFLARFQDDRSLDDVRSEYIDVFDRAAESNALYESAHGRALGKGNTLADVAAFYHAFGMEPGSDGTEAEMVDHVAMELEFYGVLLLKQAYLTSLGDGEGVQIVGEARRKFLDAHLGRLVPAIAARAEVMRSATFGPVFTWCASLVQQECGALGVSPAALEGSHGEAEGDTVECGATVARLPVLS
ncbi:MAG: molecular chaperone TorD family protein [Myxococcota bacterium]